MTPKSGTEVSDIHRSQLADIFSSLEAVIQAQGELVATLLDNAYGGGEPIPVETVEREWEGLTKSWEKYLKLRKIVLPTENDLVLRRVAERVGRTPAPRSSK